MPNLLVAFLAYSLDRLFGEFQAIRHPVIVIGSFISWFERHFYKDSIIRGVLLLLFMVTVWGCLSMLVFYGLSLLPFWIESIITAVIASMFLAHKMLRDEVSKLITAKDPKKQLSMLVSRDTTDLTESDICKAGIETYAENLSDGVIAPLFYLLFFGLPGIVLYKTINTLDSMVGYRTSRYERFGKASARMDDLLNYIPARLTAVMIMLVSKPLHLFAFYLQGKKHASPNAGHPITAMALAVGVKLGGPTRYFGELKQKAFFGHGRETLHYEDIEKSLKIGKKVDFLLILVLIIGSLYAIYG